LLTVVPVLSDPISPKLSCAVETRFIVDNLDNFYSPARKKKNLEEIAQVGSFEFILWTFVIWKRSARSSPNQPIDHSSRARAGVRPSMSSPSYDR